MNDAVGNGGEPGPGAREVEDSNTPTIAVRRATPGKSNVVQCQIRRATRPGIEFHATAVAIRATHAAAIVSEAYCEVGNTGRGIGKRTDVLVHGQCHVNAGCIARSGLNDRGILPRSNNIYGVQNFQGSLLAVINAVASG